MDSPSPYKLSIWIDKHDLSETKLKILRLVKLFGVRNDSYGYYYIVRAINLALKDIDVLSNMMDLYSKIAREDKTSLAAVESAIRRAIHRSSKEAFPMQVMFIGRPSNGVSYNNQEFIFRLTWIASIELNHNWTRGDYH